LRRLLRHLISRRGPPPASVLPLPLLGHDGGWLADVAQTVVQLGLVAGVAFLGVRWLIRALSGGPLVADARCPHRRREIVWREHKDHIRIRPATEPRPAGGDWQPPKRSSWQVGWAWRPSSGGSTPTPPRDVWTRGGNQTPGRGP
jgi:hypothetical protein